MINKSSQYRKYVPKERELIKGDRVIVRIDNEYWPSTIINTNQKAVLVRWDDPEIENEPFYRNDKCLVGRIHKQCKKIGGAEPIPKQEVKLWLRPANKKLSAKAEKSRSGLDAQIAETKEVLRSEKFSEGTHMNAYADMFINLTKIIEQTEERCLVSERTTDIYALMQLYNQLREVIADIRAVTDFGDQANRLIQDVLRPFAFDVGQNMMDIMSSLSRDLRKIMSSDGYKSMDKLSTEYTKEHGRFLQQCYMRATDQINAVLKEK